MNKILEYLDTIIPDPHCELEYNKDYELLIAIVLSAQTTDKRVNKVTRILFSKYPSLLELSNASIKDIEDIIRELGTYKRKSVYIHDISKFFVDNNLDCVPSDRKLLESLPGVGRKTANVFLATIYNEPEIAVDTHVARVCKRLGIASSNDDVGVIEDKLRKKVPEERRARTHHQLVLFGRYYCKAIKPECAGCKLTDICKYYKKNK
jgi:endonuclease-3